MAISSKFLVGDRVIFYSSGSCSSRNGKVFVILEVFKFEEKSDNWWYICKGEGDYFKAPEKNLTRRGMMGWQHNNHDVVKSYIIAPHIDGFYYCRTCRVEIDRS